MSAATPKPLIKSAVVHDDGTISLGLECDGLRWAMERAVVEDAMAFGLGSKATTARVILSGCGCVVDELMAKAPEAVKRPAKTIPAPPEPTTIRKGGLSMSEAASSTAAYSITRTDQQDNCPTCRLTWWLNPPVKITGDYENFRCIECKAVYTRSQLAAPKMLAALQLVSAFSIDPDDAQSDHYLEVLEVVRAAIARATGDA